jgi:uncharacterized protein DUF11
VTIAARLCDTYGQIRANRARNNIQESLFDLGPDTNYIGPTGNLLLPVSVANENAPPQDVCRPITGWRFTLGTGIQERAVNGLSIVTGAFNNPVPVTEASVPELNNLGQATGRTIAGAVTIQLTGAQDTLANQASRLWIQGGSPTEPLNDTAYPAQFPEGYGFGALRCAMDALNGDNVEYINYPPSATHVFCFAFYVHPRTQNARIIVCKQVPAGTQPSEDFRFVGNISFTANRDFTLTAPAATNRPNCMTFFGGGGNGSDRPVWDFTEQDTPGWRVANITCQSQTGASTATPNLATRRTEVALGAGDTVACTYTDEVRPPTAGLLLRKITHGGVGTFGFSVNPVAAGPTLHAQATTTLPGVAAPAAPEFGDLAPGDYDITKHLPHTDAGSWAMERPVTCESMPRATRSTTTRVTVAASTGTICTFENRFTPNGAIRIHKVTRGGTATTGFVIDTLGVTPPRRFEKAATTTSEGAPALATGDKTTNLPLGRYQITELNPAPTATEAWRLDTVTCNGRAVPAALGHITVVLTARRPHLDCTFANVLHREEPLPDTATGGDADSTPVADLVVTKTPSRHTITLGQTVRYTVHITNRGPATAHDVVLAEERGNHQAIVAATPARYRCSTHGTLPTCLIGTLGPGQTATVTVLARPRATGLQPDRAVLVVGTAERSLRNNVARSAVRVRRARPPRFTG